MRRGQSPFSCWLRNMPHYLLASGYEETRDFSLNTTCDAAGCWYPKADKSAPELNTLHLIFKGGGVSNLAAAFWTNDTHYAKILYGYFKKTTKWHLEWLWMLKCKWNLSYIGSDKKKKRQNHVHLHQPCLTYIQIQPSTCSGWSLKSPASIRFFSVIPINIAVSNES